jgi:hypothetical protein
MSQVVALVQDPILRFTDNTGNPLVGGTLYTTVGGIAFPTWSDSLGTIQNTNPIVLNARGEIGTNTGVSSPLFVAPNVSYTFILSDANGNLIWSAPNIVSPSTVNAIVAGLTQLSLLSILNINLQTPAEIAANVTPVNLQNPPGSLLRYGADPTGAADSSTALLNACKCNADVFDDYPGGGLYQIASEVQPPNFPLTIRGQAKNNRDVAGNVGTVFYFTSSVTGAAALAFSYVDNLRIQNIGFQFASGIYRQFGVHVKTIGSAVGQLRSSIIEACAFVGTGPSDTNGGVVIDSGTGVNQYSAFNTIRDSYFTGLLSGITLTGNCTPNTIIGNSFVGYSGAGSIAAGYGIDLYSPTVEVKILSNYFEGWTYGIYSDGAEQIVQVSNDYENCTHGFNWVQTTAPHIANLSLAEIGIAGIYSGQANLDASQIQLMGGIGWLATGGAIGSTRGFQEGEGSGTNLRAQILGYGASPGVVMAVNGSGAISAQTTTTWSVSFVGGHIYLDFSVSATLTGATTSALILPIPGGYFPVVNCQIPCSVTNNGATAFGVAYAATGAATLLIGLGAIGAGNFTAGAVGAVGQIKIRIVS